MGFDFIDGLFALGAVVVVWFVVDSGLFGVGLAVVGCVLVFCFVFEFDLGVLVVIVGYLCCLLNCWII